MSEADGKTGKRILVVDDDTQVREHVSALLESLGYTVETATSGSDALNVLEQSAQPDLLLTDIMMPGGMNGKKLADVVCSRFPDLRVVYMSGYADTALLSDGSFRLEKNFLAKPFRRRQLSDIVEQALLRQ